MADRGEHPSCSSGASIEHAHAGNSHAPLTSATARGAVSGSGVNTTLRPLEEFGKRRIGAAVLGAGDRMPGHESRKCFAELASRQFDYVLLGAARIGDHRCRCEEPAQSARARCSGLADRRGEHHQVGILDRQRRIGRVIDDAPSRRERDVRAAAADADHLRHRAGVPFECQRKRAADQTRRR